MLCMLTIYCLLSGPAHVVDGDTIDIGQTRVRIWGIDAPEMNTAAGKRSRRFLVRFLGKHTVRCYPEGFDRYGRTVALCRVNGADIARILVKMGHARDWPRYSGGYYR